MEDENLIGCAYTYDNIFLENVIDDTNIDDWDINDLINNIPKKLNNSYLQIFWNNKWYVTFNENLIESGNFLEDSLKNMYKNIKNCKNL